MAATRLKMVVNTVTRSIGASNEVAAEEITLSAVTSGDEKSVNKQWSKWTPTGQLKFTVTNPAVFQTILPGQFYYLEMIQCEKDSP